MDNHYKSTKINPCNMCMPMGGILPFKGIEGAMVILHGSQGCATYMRRHIAEHFNEPIDVASSALNEKGTVYGGEENLRKGLDNLIRVYQPKVIGVLTTCLAETIGEDIEGITQKYLQEKGLSNFPVVPVATPGYGDSHSEGYWLALRKVVEKLTVSKRPHKKINVIVPNISPADIRELKRILELMKVRYTLLPDFSDTLDRPFERPYRKIPDGGTRLKDIAGMGGAVATIQMGLTAEENISPGKYLEDRFGVPLYNTPVPIGLENTDLFINLIQEIMGHKAPAGLLQERGRLLDAMIDSHKYNFQGRSVIFGEPELTYAIAGTCLENGVYPVVVATGSKSAGFKELMKNKLAHFDWQAELLPETDFNRIRESSAGLGANIAIGSSEGRYLTERAGIPLVRMGFPIHDRVGGQRLLSVGYTGTAMFLDRVTNTLLEAKLKNYRTTMYEKFYRPDQDNVYPLRGENNAM